MTCSRILLLPVSFSCCRLMAFTTQTTNNSIHPMSQHNKHYALYLLCIFFILTLFQNDKNTAVNKMALSCPIYLTDFRIFINPPFPHSAALELIRARDGW